MKKKLLLLPILATSFLAITSCSPNDDHHGSDTPIDDYDPDDTDFDDVTPTTGDFSITTSVENGYTVSNNIYTITLAGTYTLSGALDGQVVVDTSSGKVILELNNTSITYDQNSPILASKNNDKVTINVLENTKNTITDNRATKTVDDDNMGEGALSAKADMEIKGSGTLVVTGNYNNGVHTSKDLKIGDVSLKSTAYNNAIKGNKSVSISSGNIFAISTHGDGIETKDTDTSSKGKQRGDITITGGTVNVYAAGDGLQCAHSFYMQDDDNEDTALPILYVETGAYSEYTASDASTTSYKGVKVEDELTISAGKIVLHTYDDGLHADYGTAFDNGYTGVGKININGGQVVAEVNTPTKDSGGSGWRRPPGSGDGDPWGGQQEVKGADGIHADNMVTVNDGQIKIDSAFEGIEANHIVFNGGTTKIYSTDDGLNGSQKINEEATIVFNGGFVDIDAVGDDVDGIDCNGDITMAGGVVVTKGNSSGPSTCFDIDDAFTMTGGTLVLIGNREAKSCSFSNVYQLSFSSSLAKGDWKLKIDGDIEFSLLFTGQAPLVYSSAITNGNSYILTNGTTDYQATAKAATSFASGGGRP